MHSKKNAIKNIYRRRNYSPLLLWLLGIIFSLCRDTYMYIRGEASVYPSGQRIALIVVVSLKWNVVCIVRSLAVKMTFIVVCPVHQSPVPSPQSAVPQSTVRSRTLWRLLETGAPKSFESTQLDSNRIELFSLARSLSQSFSQFLARDNNLNLVLAADGDRRQTDGGQTDKRTAGEADKWTCGGTYGSVFR